MSENPSQRQSDGRFVPGVMPPVGRQFQPGESGNPSGMPQGTAQPGRWLRGLADATPDELREIVGDPKASAAKIGAARLLLDLADGEGTPESRRRALAELLDRCEGRPRQAVDVSGDLRAASVVYQITVEGGEAGQPIRDEQETVANESQSTMLGSPTPHAPPLPSAEGADG